MHEFNKCKCVNLMKHSDSCQFHFKYKTNEKSENSEKKKPTVKECGKMSLTGFHSV